MLGPGLLGTDEAQGLLEGVLPRLSERTSVLLDAVALTALARCPTVLDALAGRVVLTPNAGECAALLDDEPSTDLDAARRIADRYGAVVCLHGGTAAPDGRRAAAGSASWPASCSTSCRRPSARCAADRVRRSGSFRIRPADPFGSVGRILSDPFRGVLPGPAAARGPARR